MSFAAFLAHSLDRASIEETSSASPSRTHAHAREKAALSGYIRDTNQDDRGRRQRRRRTPT
jgi:hypothetical protein